jgi:16S rRNA (guanine966-N2)-methyltransferase
VELRPTPDRVRETLFNWLQDRVPGARCLDLYAGSGALGLEALSRGAADVVFVEQQRRAAQALEQLLREWQHEPLQEPQERLGVWRVICAQALQFLAGEPRSGEARVGAAAPRTRYDVVFLDPPFASGELSAAAAALERGGWLAPQARIYLEHARATPLPALPDGWQELRAGHAGEVGYHLFTRAANASARGGQP